jgi:hypothetical protein
MLNIAMEDPLAVAVVGTIHKGDVESLQRLLQENPRLATARLDDPNECKGMSRSLLHVATDWPGHFPNGAATVAALIAAGAEVNARFTGPHTETPLHWAASSDDGPCSILLNAALTSKRPGPSLAAARRWPIQWRSGNGRRQRLVSAGRMALWQAAALGLMDRFRNISPAIVHLRWLRGRRSCTARRSAAGRDHPRLWCACHGEQRQPGAYLLVETNIIGLIRWAHRETRPSRRGQGVG